MEYAFSLKQEENCGTCYSMVEPETNTQNKISQSQKRYRLDDFTYMRQLMSKSEKEKIE
jgi:hypothetical protein